MIKKLEDIVTSLSNLITLSKHVFSMSGCITHEKRTSILVTLKTLMNYEI